MLSTIAVERMRLSRAGQPMEVISRTHSRQRGYDAVLSFGYEQQSGSPEKIQATQQNGGRVHNNHITWDAVADAASDARPRDWPAGAGGYFALEQSLLHSPLKPGEKRAITSLMPLIDVFVDTQLAAVDHEPVELLDRTARLLRIESVAELPGGVRLATTLWCDEQGEILKSEVPAMKLVTMRAERETALISGEAAPDLFKALLVKVDPPLENAHGRDEVSYEVRKVVGDAEQSFPADYRQRWEPSEGSRARLTATATWGDYWTKHASPAPAANQNGAYLKPLGLVDHDDPAVQKLAHSVGGQERDAWQLAQMLEQLVNSTIQEKNLESAMASASEVARARAGDCTEHAVLLAALCRSRDIPARVAIGLVYVPQASGFLYHMWNEVWIKNGWRPLDATFARGGIGAAHLKISDSALDERGGYPSVLPVLNFVGQVEIRVRSEK